MIEVYKKCARCGMQNQASKLTASGLCLYCAWREWKRYRKQEIPRSPCVADVSITSAEKAARGGKTGNHFKKTAPPE